MKLDMIETPLQLAVDADCLAPGSPLIEDETRRYAIELISACTRKGVVVNCYAENAFSHPLFEVNSWMRFSPNAQQPVLYFDYLSKPAPPRRSDRHIVFIDHLSPLGLKERVFDQWAEAEQIRYRNNLDSLRDTPTLAITSSDWTRRDLLTWSGLPPGRVFALGGGVSTDFLGPPVPNTSSELLAQLNLHHRFCLVWHSDEPLLPLEIAIAVYLENKKYHSDIQLLICYESDNDTVTILKKWCADQNHADILFAKGPGRQIIRQLLAGAACLLHPQLYDGFNLKIIDAMSQACPVLTTRSSAFPEVGGDTVLYANPLDAEELARNLHSVLADAGIRSSMKNRAFLRAGKFRWDAVAEQFIQHVTGWLPKAHLPLYREIDRSSQGKV